MLLQELLFIFVVFVAVFIQSVAGFGGTLIAMPLGILLVGVGTAKPVMTIIALLTGAAVALAGTKHIQWKELLKMTSVMLIGVLMGLWLFGSVSLQFLLILYAIVIVLIGLKKLFYKSSRELPPLLQWAALAVAGIMQGLFVSGGSFLAVYAVSRIPEKESFRSTVNAVWVFLNIFLIASYWAQGALTGPVLTMSFFCVIPTLLAVWIAGIVAKKMKQETFLKISYLILIVSGSVLLITNL